MIMKKMITTITRAIPHDRFVWVSATLIILCVNITAKIINIAIAPMYTKICTAAKKLASKIAKMEATPNKAIINHNAE
jgi:hypothetical protein